MSDHDQQKSDTKDPVMSEETGQSPPAENVVDDDDTGANRNPNAPQHGGYGRPV